MRRGMPLPPPREAAAGCSTFEVTFGMTVPCRCHALESVAPFSEGTFCCSRAAAAGRLTPEIFCKEYVMDVRRREDQTHARASALSATARWSGQSDVGRARAAASRVLRFLRHYSLFAFLRTLSLPVPDRRHPGRRPHGSLSLSFSALYPAGRANPQRCDAYAVCHAHAREGAYDAFGRRLDTPAI